MVNNGDIDQYLTGLGIENEENESFVMEENIVENVSGYDLCLVRRLLTEKY